MATAQSKLDILIEAKNNASGTLKQVGTDAGGLERALVGVGAGLAAAFSVQAIRQIAETSFELARTGAEAERLQFAFDSLASGAGQSGDAILASLREASQGTISNADLMLAANKAMLLGVADDANEMAGLMEVAAARGKAMGLTTSQAFSDIVTGIGRESKMILDNLGILVDTEAANNAYADSLGKTAAQLSDVERKQALLNQVLESSTDIVRANESAGRDAAANFERMDASIQNAKEALGELFEPAMVVVAQAIADAADAAASGMTEMASNREIQKLAIDMELTSQQAMALEQQIGQLENGLRRLEAAGQTNNQQYRDAQAELQSLREQLANVNGTLVDYGVKVLTADDMTRGLSAATGMLDQNFLGLDTSARIAARGIEEAGLMAVLATEQMNAAIAQSREIAGSIESAAASSGALFAGKQGGDAGLARQQQVTSELKAQQKLWEDQGYTQQQIADVLMPGYVSQLREADSALFRAGTKTKTLSEEAKAAKQAFEEIKSAVEGVLQGALDPGVGVNPDDVLEKLGLPREDAINESARRLADIAQNGLKGQDWLGDFANDVPDIWRMIRTAQNPQEEAAYLLRDFQDGLLTAAIDKDKAKAIVKRQILGDQNMAAMAQEIATELAAEMGVPMQQALAAAQGALGGGGTLGVGGDAAQGFTDGANANLDETNAGGTFVDKFIAQARASYASLKTAGADGGKQWGDGFMATVGENVPPALISLLTNLVTPGVMAQFAQRGTLTGATP